MYVCMYVCNPSNNALFNQIFKIFCHYIRYCVYSDVASNSLIMIVPLFLIQDEFHSINVVSKGRFVGSYPPSHLPQPLFCVQGFCTHFSRASRNPSIVQILDLPQHRSQSMCIQCLHYKPNADSMVSASSFTIHYMYMPFSVNHEEFDIDVFENMFCILPASKYVLYISVVYHYQSDHFHSPEHIYQ